MSHNDENFSIYFNYFINFETIISQFESTKYLFECFL